MWPRINTDATLMSVDKDIPGSATVRCHTIEGNKWACHQESSELAKKVLAGEVKVVSVQAADLDAKPSVVRTGVVHCMLQDIERRTHLELNTYCHTFPRGLTVVKRELFCAHNDCGA